MKESVYTMMITSREIHNQESIQHADTNRLEQSNTLYFVFGEPNGNMHVL